MDGHPGNSENNEDILEAVLTQAFSPPPSRRQSMQPDLQAQLNTPGFEVSELEASLNASQAGEDTSIASREPSVEESSVSSGSTDDSWKAEYESQVESWRAQSSEARVKAEKERERWEAIRAAEQEEAARRKVSGTAPEPTVAREEQEAEWETVTNRQSHTESAAVSEFLEPSPADSRDLVTGESESQFTVPSTNAGPPTGLPRTHSHQDTGDESQKWEDIQSSVTSSFPSMSYPERSETPSPSQNRSVPPPPPAPLSATLAIFDSTLSSRTRVMAFFSSLAINMLLPFVNGVMLGFGEIFAKNVVMEWLGWKASGPGSVATTAGIGVASPWGRRPAQRQS